MGVGDDEQGLYTPSLLRDAVEIHGNERVAALDGGAGSNANRKAVAVEIDRVDTEVDENLGATWSSQCQRVRGVMDKSDPSIARCQHLRGKRFDRHAVSCRTGREGRVGYVAQGNDDSILSSVKNERVTGHRRFPCQRVRVTLAR